jgi:eukaryotic-like serine/threonine-protein kinase
LDFEFVHQDSRLTTLQGGQRSPIRNDLPSRRHPMAIRKPSLARILVIVFTLSFTLAVLFAPALFQPLELKLYDAAMRFAHGGTQTDRPVVLIEIDRKSLKTMGPWPWPRRVLGEMLTLLGRQGAKVIGLHFPLGEREGTRVLKEFRAFKERFSAYSFSKKDEGMREWVLEGLKEVEENLNSDRMLVERIRQARNVVLPVFLDPSGEETSVDPVNDRVLQMSGIREGGLPLLQGKGIPRARVAPPFAELSEAALGLGHAGLSVWRGMEGRSHPLFLRHERGLLPSFPLRAVMGLLGRGPNQVVAEPSELRIQDLSIPLWDGEMLVPFRRVELERHSFAEVLKGGKGVPAVGGKIVLIGFNLEESVKVDTPLSDAMPVLEFYARVADAILAKDFIRRPHGVVYFEAAAVAMIGVLAAFLFLNLSHGIRTAGTFGLLVLVLGFGFLLFSYGLWAKTGAVALFVVILSLAFTLSRLIGKSATAAQSRETSRLLGIGFQRGGLLDQALAEFRKLPLDRESKELLYQLGVEFEQRGAVEKALDVYEYLNRHENFKDVPERVRRIRQAVSSSSLPGDHPEEESQGVPGEAKAEETRARVGRYEILQELGKGSMGLVYKAMDPKLHRLLAVKTIRFSDEFDQEVIQEIKARFFREAEIAGRLSHPGIVTVYDVGEDRDLTYIAMEFLEGEDLEKHIIAETLLPLRRVLDVVASVADALDFAHKSGVIHRDIKPANIMLLKQGGVKVTDFGIAKAISSSRTKTGIILGTPNYMSPEQIMGQKIDYRSDIFSLGVLSYQLLTGELPFRADNLSSLLHQITQVKPTPVRERNPRIPRVCEQLVDKALAKDPTQRFGSAGEMCKLTRLIISKMDQMKKGS